MSWFGLLDFLKVRADAIKSLFWTDRLKTFHQDNYIDPPKTLWRNHKMLKELSESGTTQKRAKVKEYSIFDDHSELIKLYEEESTSDTDDSTVFTNEGGEFDGGDNGGDGEMQYLLSMQYHSCLCKICCCICWQYP